jgi:hypothetical protein
MMAAAAAAKIASIAVMIHNGFAGGASAFSAGFGGFVNIMAGSA